MGVSTSTVQRQRSGRDAMHIVLEKRRALLQGPSASPHTLPALTSQYAKRIYKLERLLAAPPAPSRRPHFSLRYGEPLLMPSMLQHWREALIEAAGSVGPQYPPPEGHLLLREEVATHLAKRRGVQCDPADILICGGTQQALSLVARVVLDVHDTVALEEPHYFLAASTLLAQGARVISVATDEEGLVVQRLPHRTVRLVHVTPSHQFPSGVVMSRERRLALLEWSGRSGSWIFEDDYDSEFHLGERPEQLALRSLDRSDRVLYVGSFSKTLFPSLRLGYIVCPKALRDLLYKAKLLDDLGSPAMEQMALAGLMKSGRYQLHLEQSRIELANRRAAARQAFTCYASESVRLEPDSGGLHLVAWLPRLNFKALPGFIERVAQAGVAVYPIHPYYCSEPPRTGLLVGYAGLSCAELDEAIRRVAQCLDDI